MKKKKKIKQNKRELERGLIKIQHGKQAVRSEAIYSYLLVSVWQAVNFNRLLKYKSFRLKLGGRLIKRMLALDELLIQATEDSGI